MKNRFYSLLLLTVVTASSFSSCSSSDEHKRKKVVPPVANHDSSLPWNRPKSWEGTARYGGMVPVSH